MFCLTSPFTDKLKQAIRSGQINPEKMTEMTSQERRDFLTGIIGKDNAKEVNQLFEQKLLLKNQEKAMYDWARQITGMSKEAKEATMAKIKQTFADKNRRLYEPAENEKFLNEITSDVYSKKYKTEVTLDEAQTITELAQDAKVAKEKMTPDFAWATKQDGLNYGASKVALDNYVGELKLNIAKESLVNPLVQKGIGAKIGAVWGNAKISWNFIADNSRAIVASMDNSLWFRQGLKALMNPRYSKVWLDNFATSWQDIGKTIKGGNKTGDAVLDGVKAEIYSRPNYLNGRYEMGKKLDIGTGEEAYPSSFPSRIPVLGRLFKASEVAYEAGAMRLRVDIADKLYSLAEKSGVDMKNKVEVGDMNEVINSMTGRGSLGKYGQGKALNAAFFSIKFFKSNYDFLVAPVKAVLDLSSFAKKQAAINTLSVVATTAVVMQIAKSLNPDKNKDIFNPTSSNFGKIKIGDNMTIDITGGVSGLMVVIGKIVNQKSTSTATGIATPLGSGYGQQSGMDVLFNFAENKLSPIAGVLRDIIKQQTFSGQKPTILTESKSLITPILVGNVNQFKTEEQAIQIIGLIADGLGLNASVYAPSATDWGQSTGKELEQFKAKVGDAKFKEANDLFNKQYSDWLKQVQTDGKYKALTDEEKATVNTNKKAEIKSTVLKHYGFTYKSAPTKKLPKF